MSKPTISMIAALTSDRSIGKDGDLVVRIPDDLKRFKALTMGHPIIMGRKTYESIGMPLPGRTNIVVTRNESFAAPGIVICRTLDEAIEKASAEGVEVFVIGGGEIYAQALPHASKLYLTIVESDARGDVKFPAYDDFNKISRTEDRVDEKTGLKYSWIDLER